MTTLRRADWRFLLPAPEHDRYRRLVLVGGSDELLRGVGALADESSRGAQGIERADLVVLMADRDLPLAPLLARVASDAALYVEVDRRRAGSRLLTPGRLRGLLRRHGLASVASYWVIPDLDRARRHVPLDAPRVMAWYLETLQTGGSAVTRVADVGIRMLAAVGPGPLAALVPCFATMAVGRSRRAAGVGVLAPAEGAVAMLTSGQDDGSRVVLLPFERAQDTPSRVVKVARLPSFEGHTEREQRTLADLRARLPPELGHLVPEPLGMRRWKGLLVAEEGYAGGAPLAVSVGRMGRSFEATRADLRHGVDWLIAFHRATRIGDPRRGQAIATRAGARLHECRRHFAETSVGHSLLEQAAGAAGRWSGSGLPLVPLHNDLGPWNMHRAGGRVTVIDWELGAGDVADRIGPGPCDLLYFVTYWYLRTRHLTSADAELRGIRELFVRPVKGDRGSSAVLEEIERYAEALAVEREWLPLLLTLTWAERALDWAERAGNGDPSGEQPRINRYARYLEVIADRRAEWFVEHRWP